MLAFELTPPRGGASKLSRAQLAAEADAAYARQLGIVPDDPKPSNTTTPKVSERVLALRMAARIREQADRAERSVVNPESSIDHFKGLVDHFREERWNLIFEFAQVSEDTRYRKLFNIQQRWKRHRRAVGKYLTQLEMKHGVVLHPSRYMRLKIFSLEAWNHFKTVRSIVRKRATKKGLALRSRANHKYYETTVKPKRAKLTEAEREAANTARRAEYQLAKEEKIKGRIASAKHMLFLQKELDDVVNNRVSFRGKDPEAMRLDSIESYSKQISEIRKLLGKTLKRTLALIEGK